jgi:Secretion system C-terminal sorting domain
MKSKLTLTILLSLVLISASSFVFISNSGIAAQTGSPGEATCSNCHGGGSSSASAITISSTPSFSNNEYVPGTTYTIEITVSASGFSKFGFGCEILNASNANAGLIQTAGPGVKFLNVNVQGTQRKNAVHTTGKLNSGSATFTFEWVASQTGAVTIYAAGNAANGNNSTTGDLPIAPISLALQAEVPIDPVGIKETNLLLGEMSIYPQPSNGISNLSYVLKQPGLVEISICDLSGKELQGVYEGKQDQGPHLKLINTEGLRAGVYFLKLSVEGQQLSQKLFLVN